ncbi:MAG: DEAD/DEAH box helicase [Pirellulales bacterium]|nr:DEAD/DEAH box helicase [Pirellulales bacterium]
MATAAVKPSHLLTFRDRLSRLSFEQACKLLGPEGKKLIVSGSRREINLNDDVYFGGDLLRVTFHGPDGPEAIATLTMATHVKDRLAWNCDSCKMACEHVGAVLSTVLEHKTQLGLAAPPDRKPAVEQSDDEATIRALDERKDRARTEKMKIASSDQAKPWADYAVTSLLSGKTYRVALRGLKPGESYCTCPDFRTNTLGTCKHILKVCHSVKRKFTPRQLARPYKPWRIAVHLRYDREVTLQLVAPEQLSAEQAEIVRPWRDRPITDVRGLLRQLQRLEAVGGQFHIFPDAEEFIQQRLHAERIRDLVAEIRRDPANHALRDSLMKVKLLPYQLDGIAFAVGSGRAVLADDMGLGKTIQAVGVAELLAREAEIRKVLVVCPASLKSQWRNEIHRFCNRDVQLIAGRTTERSDQYGNSCFFTVCNYEQVLRDIGSIEKSRWDLIVLDEGQRIKNWESKTSRVIKALKSRFALVLSGTPLENRLDELYSVVQFIDDRRLGPGFRFFNQHRIVDEKGKVLGYKNLDRLRQRLQPILLRRTRDSVRLELPERTTEIVRIPPSDEQLALHDAHMQKVAAIVRKKFISEMDLLRLRMALLMCRMSADASYLVTKEKPNFSTKLERLEELFDDIADEADRKVVLFSEWTTMLDLIEPLLKHRRMNFVRLDGSVPQKEREQLVHEFQTNPECRFFLTSNAGSTGLNLQAANTVINVDLPWNPAVLEQRIGRAHRMGQTQSVQVFILVTEGTLEENLLATLSAKKDLALAALDPNSDVDTVEMRSGTEELKSRLEILLGAKPAAPLDQSVQQQREQEVQREQIHRQRVSEAGGQLLGAVFQFLDQLVTGNQEHSPHAPEPMVNDLRTRLESCVESDAEGRPRLTVTLPSRKSLDQLSQTLARLMVAGTVGGENVSTR